MFRVRTKSAAAFVGLALTLILSGAVTRPYHRNQKAFYADPKLVAFVRPGLTIKITSAAIAQDGTITVNYSLNGPPGPSFGPHGRTTPGSISTTFIAAYIPAGQTQYVDYVTRMQTGAVSGTVTQAAGENNGVFTAVGDGVPVHVHDQGSGGLQRCGHPYDRHLRIAESDRVRPRHELRQRNVQFRA